jgi:hypothetical protein
MIANVGFGVLCVYALEQEPRVLGSIERNKVAAQDYPGASLCLAVVNLVKGLHVRWQNEPRGFFEALDIGG